MQANIQSVRYDNPQPPDWQTILGGAAEGLSGAIGGKYERERQQQEDFRAVLPALVSMGMAEPTTLTDPGAIKVGGQAFRITKRPEDAADIYNQTKADQIRQEMDAAPELLYQESLKNAALAGRVTEEQKVQMKKDAYAAYGRKVPGSSDGYWIKDEKDGTIWWTADISGATDADADLKIIPGSRDNQPDENDPQWGESTLKDFSVNPVTLAGIGVTGAQGLAALGKRAMTNAVPLHPAAAGKAAVKALEKATMLQKMRAGVGAAAMPLGATLKGVSRFAGPLTGLSIGNTIAEAIPFGQNIAGQPSNVGDIGWDALGAALGLWQAVGNPDLRSGAIKEAGNYFSNFTSLPR